MARNMAPARIRLREHLVLLNLALLAARVHTRVLLGGRGGLGRDGGFTLGGTLTG